jgi:hypothetical protein
MQSVLPSYSRQRGCGAGLIIDLAVVSTQVIISYISSGAPPGIDGRGQCLNVSAIVPTTVPYTFHGLTEP